MSEGEVVIPEFRVKYKDVFSLRNLYIMMHEMLLEENWLGKESDTEHTDIETLYSENLYQKGLHRGGKELWFWWRASKKGVEDKYSGYFRNKLDIDAHCVYLQNVEVVHQGKKMTAQNCEIEIFFRAKIEMDYQHLWENHWLLKYIKPLYEKRIMHAEIEKREKELWRDVYKIQSKIKQYLGLRTWMTTPEPFFPRQFGFEE